MIPEWIVQMGPTAGVVVVVGMFLKFGRGLQDVIRENTAVVSEVKGILLKMNGKR